MAYLVLKEVVRSRACRVTAASVVGVLALGCCGTAFGTTKAELIAEIEARRVAIQDLDVDFVFYATGVIPSHAVRHDARRVVLKGDDRILIERVYRIGDTSYETTASLTGSRGWGHQAVNRLAYTRAGADIPLVTTEGSGFFDLMMWFPCEVARTGDRNPNDLLSVLESEASLVAPQTELIDGHMCHVVEVVGAFDAIVARVWIDPERGFLPVRQVYYDPAALPPAIVLSLAINDAIEVVEDVWLAVSGQRETLPSSDFEELANGLNYTMSVQADASGLRLKVNEGVGDTVFDLSTKLPPRTLVSDLDTGHIAMASARDYSATADSALASLSEFTRAEPELDDLLHPRGPVVSIGWLGLMLGAGVAGAAASFVRVRRRTEA